jgi:hypothetical protein
MLFPQLTSRKTSHTLPLGVVEDYHTLPLTPMFKLLGVPVLATPRAWTNPIGMILPMLVMTAILAPGVGLLERIVVTAFWVLLFEFTSFTHSIGHIIGGKLAGGVMDRLVVTSTRQVNVYDGDQDRYPARVHITRALGGPVGNLVVGLLASLAIAMAGYTPSLFLLAVMNLVFGAGAFAPIPSVDGEVLARYLFKKE